jgi:hypothetical protein
MSNTESSRDLPENYIYNKYNYRKENSQVVSARPIQVNIDDYVYELMQCGSDREKFDEIMTSLGKKFLDGENLSSDDESISKKVNSINSNSNRAKNKIDLDELKNSKFSKRGDDLSSYNNISRHGVYPDHLQNNNFTNSTQNYNYNIPYIQKKYTDVHANTKFHYPDNYNEDTDDLSLDKSLWTDRANTNILYNRQNTNFSNVSNAYTTPNYYYDQYNKYPDKLNTYIYPNKMDDSLRSHREVSYSNSDRYNLGKRNLYGDDL